MRALLLGLALCAAGGCLGAQDLGLYGRFGLGARVGWTLKNHLADFDRVYVEAYTLLDFEQSQQHHALWARHFVGPDWRILLGQDCLRLHVKRIALVDNSTFSDGRTYRADGLDHLLNNQAVRAGSAQALVQMALHDGWDGLAVQFQGSDPAFKSPYLEWFRALVAAAHAKGMTVDVLLAVQGSDDDNRAFAGMQSFRGLAEAADQAIVSKGAAIMTGDGGLSDESPEREAVALDYAQANVPAGKGVLSADVGGRLYRNGQMIYFGQDAWVQDCRGGMKPERRPNGLLRLELPDGGSAVWADPLAMIRGLKDGVARGYRRFLFAPAAIADGGFWPWWEQNLGKLAAPAAAPSN